MSGKTERIEIRLTPEGAQSVDEWRRHQIDHPSRAEAVCRLVEAGLNIPDAGADFPLIYLTLQLVCDLHLRAGIESDQASLDAQFVRRMVQTGDLWALNWQYHLPWPSRWPEAPPAVQEVCDILEMYDLMEAGFEALPAEEREGLEKFRPVRGFDGNGESEQAHIASILEDDLERWPRFRGRVGNTHYPVMDTYRRMLRTFVPMKAGAQMRPGCTAAEIATLLQARIHPDHRR